MIVSSFQGVAYSRFLAEDNQSLEPNKLEKEVKFEPNKLVIG